jgi:phosphate transport system protein
MPIRSNYLHELIHLQQRLQSLSDAVDRAIDDAVWALAHRNKNTAQCVIDGDAEIDDLRYDIEEQAIQLIARQQPLASDLRLISAVIILASEIERIGDYAEGIAEIVLRSPDQPMLEVPPAVSQMARMAREMLRQSLQAFINRDMAAAQKQSHADDQVDDLYQQLVQDLLAVMREHPEQSEMATYLLWVAHNLERVADRTVNIAERTIFIITGALDPHQPRAADDTAR